MDIKKNTLLLQEKLNINFKDISLLQLAITHSSYANEKQITFNERLEFLGDAVLELIISQYLYETHPDKPEGFLTRMRALIVCENSLHTIAKKWNLGEFLYMSRGEELTGGRERASILADAVEAILAAIYKDKGLEEVSAFVLKHFKPIIDKASKNQIILDYKTKIQEILQQNGEVKISYESVGFEGPPHRRKFFVELYIEGKLLGKGEGYSKKEAEQMAAKNALLVRGDIDE